MKSYIIAKVGSWFWPCEFWSPHRNGNTTICTLPRKWDRLARRQFLGIRKHFVLFGSEKTLLHGSPLKGGTFCDGVGGGDIYLLLNIL